MGALEQTGKELQVVFHLVSAWINSRHIIGVACDFDGVICPHLRRIWVLRSIPDEDLRMWNAAIHYRIDRRDHWRLATESNAVAGSGLHTWNPLVLACAGSE
jgi:hypothetical protein